MKNQRKNKKNIEKSRKTSKKLVLRVGPLLDLLSIDSIDVPEHWGSSWTTISAARFFKEISPTWAKLRV